MKPPVRLLLFLALLASANATPLDDLTRLKQSIASASSHLEASRNATAALNTSDLIQSIGYQVGASMANLGCINSATPAVGAAPGNDTTNAATNLFENVYNEYTTHLTRLAENIASRGRAQHAEFDFPVQTQLASLCRVVYNYGLCCRNADLIGTVAAIQTWEAEKRLTDAQTAWENGWQNLATVTPRTSPDERRGKKLRRDTVRVSKVRRSGSEAT